LTAGTLAPPIEPTTGPEPDARTVYRCDCGQVLRVSGGGRHRVYFDPGNAALDDPVMNRVCPACGAGLPGKNGP
jgi:hypothetical protein